MRRIGARRLERLRAALESAASDFDPAARLPLDPLGVVREYDRSDREVVAHVVAPLAYGAVAQIRRAARAVLGTLGDSPTVRLRTFVRGDFVRANPGFVYRMTRAGDVDAYLAALGSVLRSWPTLEDHFVDQGEGVAGARSVGAAQPVDVRDPLARYVGSLRGRMSAAQCGDGRLTRGMRYLTPDPGSGSATKRWYLMLRWLVRADDGVDLGLWTRVEPSRLVLPMDTHVARLARDLGLTDRATVDYRMAREATDVLARLDAADPLRFDMPLCHLGVAGDCLHRFEPAVCGGCGLRGVCRWGACA